MERLGAQRIGLEQTGVNIVSTPVCYSFAPDDVLFVNDEDIEALEEIAAENYARTFR